MQETWKFDISPENRNDDPEIILGDILETNGVEMGIFLSYYYKREGAVAEKIQLKNDGLFISGPLQGRFTVEFDLIHFNACLNIHDQAKENMEIQFEIDRDFKSIILTGPYWPEREMDEI